MLSEELLQQIKDINKQYNDSLIESFGTREFRLSQEDLPGIRSNQGRAQGLDDVGPLFSEAAASGQIRNLLNEAGVTIEDLQTSREGSGTDTYVDLGIGNAIYNRGAFNPQGGSDYDVVAPTTTTGFADPNDYLYGEGGHVYDDSNIGESTLRQRGNEAGFFSSPIASILATVLAPGTGGLSVVAQQALRAIDGETLHGSDYANAAASYAGAQLGSVGGSFGDAYNAQNVGGAFIRGAAPEAIGQAVSGDFDLAALGRAGLLSAGTGALSDLVGDARQTNEGNLYEGIDTLNGTPISAEDVERLTNTSDLYGILGEEGLLSKVGIDVGYLPTDYIGDGLDLIGFGGRPEVAALQEAANDRYRETAEAIQNDDSLSYFEKSEQLTAAHDQYYTDTARYDERFFDLTTERSSDANLTGIYEQNPFAHSGPSISPIVGGGEGGGSTNSTPIMDSSFPEYGGMTPTSDPAYQEFMQQDPVASIDQEDLLPDTTEDYLPDTTEDYLPDTGGQEVPLTPEQEVLEEELQQAEEEEVPLSEVLPEGGDILPQEEDLSSGSSSEGPPSGATAPPAATRTQSRRRGIDEYLNRLARVMRVNTLDPATANSVMARISSLLGEREALEADTTAVVDPASTNYIQRERVKEKRKRRQPTLDPIEQAIAAVT